MSKVIDLKVCGAHYSIFMARPAIGNAFLSMIESGTQLLIIADRNAGTRVIERLYQNQSNIPRLLPHNGVKALNW